jgi:hypothetical protein
MYEKRRLTTYTAFGTFALIVTEKRMPQYFSVYVYFVATIFSFRH